MQCKLDWKQNMCSSSRNGQETYLSTGGMFVENFEVCIFLHEAVYVSESDVPTLFYRNSTSVVLAFVQCLYKTPAILS